MSEQRDRPERSANGAPVPPTTADIYDAARTVRKYLPKTPLVRSDTLSAAFDADVYLKREDTLPTGAFKVRGGVNFAANLPAAQRERGLVTASTGNHGQSTAYAGREFDVPVTIVVPEETNPAKVAAIRRLGAMVEHHGKDMDSAVAHAMERAGTGMTESEKVANEGPRFVHPANEPRLVAGVATAGLSVVEELPDVDYVVCPIGGGSSATGYCLTASRLASARVVGVQPTGADAVYRALHGNRTPCERIDTCAEGLAVGTAFDLPLSVLREELHDVLRVEDDAIRRRVYQLLNEEGIIAEGAAAASVAGAAALDEKLTGRTVVLPISGRNLSTAKLMGILADFA